LDNVGKVRENVKVVQGHIDIVFADIKAELDKRQNQPYTELEQFFHRKEKELLAPTR